MKRFNTLVKVRVYTEYSDAQYTEARRRAQEAGTDLRTIVQNDAKKAVNRVPDLTYHDTRLRTIKTAGKVGGFQIG